MRALFEGRLRPVVYTELLHALHDHFVAWEAAHAGTLERAAEQGWEWASRAALLARDLGVREPARPVRAGIAAVTAPQSTAHGWGALYVIEGSTLGARLLVSKLRAAFPGSTALRYFSLGDDDPQRWRRFEQVLERALADPATHPDAIAGARATFADFTATLSRITA